MDRIEPKPINADRLSEILTAIQVSRDRKELTASDISNLTSEALTECQLEFRGIKNKQILLEKEGSIISYGSNYGAFAGRIDDFPMAHTILAIIYSDFRG